MKFFRFFERTREPLGEELPEGTRLTEDEWWHKRILDRIYTPRAPQNLSDPRNVIDWAMGVRRPGEGCGLPESRVDHDAAAYIAECVQVAEFTKEENFDHYDFAVNRARAREESKNTLEKLQILSELLKKTL